MTATYAITYKPSVAKAFKSIHPQDRRRIKDAIEALALDPRPVGATMLVEGGSSGVGR